MNFIYQLVSGSEGQANKRVGKEQYRAVRVWLLSALR